VESFGNAPGGFAYDGAVAGPDGRVYCVTHNADHVLVIDPARRSAVPLQFPGNEPVGGRWKCVGGVMGPDGRIYFVPFNAKHLLAIGKKQRMNMNWVPSPMFNKL
jgi:streptogramin lyase